jgi:hypothetical protein
MANFSSSELWMKFLTLSHGFLLRWNCGSKLIKSYLDTSRFEPWWFIAWGCFMILCILTQVTKTWRYCIISFLHCTIPYTSWMHHRINIDSPMHFNLEQECRYPMPPSMCLDDLVTIFCLHWSLLIGYTLKAKIRWVITWKPHRTLIELHCKLFMLLWSSSATFL